METFELFLSSIRLDTWSSSAMLSVRFRIFQAQLFNSRIRGWCFVRTRVQVTNTIYSEPLGHDLVQEADTTKLTGKSNQHGLAVHITIGITRANDLVLGLFLLSRNHRPFTADYHAHFIAWVRRGRRPTNAPGLSPEEQP